MTNKLAFAVVAATIGTMLHLALWGLYGMLFHIGFFSSISAMIRQQAVTPWPLVAAAILIWRLRPLPIVLLSFITFGSLWAIMSLPSTVVRTGFHWGVYWYGAQPIVMSLIYVASGLSIWHMGTTLGWELHSVKEIRKCVRRDLP